jgi:hypothetical protein
VPPSGSLNQASARPKWCTLDPTIWGSREIGWRVKVLGVGQPSRAYVVDLTTPLLGSMISPGLTTYCTPKLLKNSDPQPLLEHMQRGGRSLPYVRR